MRNSVNYSETNPESSYSSFTESVTAFPTDPLLAEAGSSYEFKRKTRKFHLTKRIIMSCLEFLGISAFSLGYSWVFILPYCNFLFHCGCTWTWQGGFQWCNVNNPSGPHCPWCAAPDSINWIPQWGGMLVMILSALLIRWKWLQGVEDSTAPKVLMRFFIMIIGSIGTFYLFGFLHGLVFRGAMHYPLFLWS